jgi:hypothetical protein
MQSRIIKVSSSVIQCTEKEERNGLIRVRYSLTDISTEINLNHSFHQNIEA